MAQQPEALRIADALDTYDGRGATTEQAAAELRRLHDIEAGYIDRVDGLLAERDALRAQVERLQAAGQVLPPELIARVDGWRCSGDSEWAKGVNSGIDAAVGILLATNTTPAQEAADTGADERVQFEKWARSEGLITSSHGLMSINFVCDTARLAWNARAALAVRTGANEGAGVVRLTDEQRENILVVAGAACDGLDPDDWGHEIIDMVEAHHGINGLTVGGIQASGRVGK